MRYIAIKYGLTANDENSKIRQDLVEQQLQDLYVLFIWGILLNQPEFEKKIEIFSKQTLPQHLELLSKYLDQNEWFATNITYVDFYAYEILDWMRLFSPQCLDKWQNLTQFMKRFESLPAIASYLSSEEFKSWPILSPRSKWGHRK
jgi:glutathione S-transferase